MPFANVLIPQSTSESIMTDFPTLFARAVSRLESAPANRSDLIRPAQTEPSHSRVSVQRPAADGVATPADADG